MSISEELPFDEQPVILGDEEELFVLEDYDEFDNIFPYPDPDYLHYFEYFD